MRKEEFPFSFFARRSASFLLLPSRFSFPPLLFLSGCLLLLVVDRDSDDGRAPADHPDGREAPLELAVAHLRRFFFFHFFRVFHFFS